MNVNVRGLIALATMTPSLALAASLCEKYTSDIRSLLGEGELVFESKTRNSEEAGCRVIAAAARRSVNLAWDIEDGSDQRVRATKANYVNGGIKTEPVSEPSLGREGFSLLAGIATTKPNYLVVGGHKGPLGVVMTLTSQPPAELTGTDLNRARTLLKKFLDSESVRKP